MSKQPPDPLVSALIKQHAAAVATIGTAMDALRQIATVPPRNMRRARAIAESATAFLEQMSPYAAKNKP